LIKNLQQITLLPVLLENSEPKLDKSTKSDNSEMNRYTNL